MTAFVMLRHGPTTWNTEGRIQGQSDIPLSPAGREEVARWRLPAEFAGSRWICSPLARARETAAILGISVDRYDERLKEMHWGDWEGERLSELRERLGTAMAEREALGLDFRPEGGESPREVQDRVAPLLAEIAAAGRPTGAVCHRGVIRAVYARAIGWDMTGKPPEKIENACLHAFTLSAEGRPRLDEMNRSLLDGA